MKIELKRIFIELASKHDTAKENGSKEATKDHFRLMILYKKYKPDF
jgi:hypothetical protein